MSEIPQLTMRQQQILALIENSISQWGAPPTRVEIAKALGFKSPNAAEDHLRALARKGVIELVSGTSRGIRLKKSRLVLPLLNSKNSGNQEKRYCVDSSLFTHCPDYLFQVQGMSLRDDGIIDGDLLAIQSTHKAHNGQMILTRWGDEITIQRFHPNLSSERYAIEGVAVGLIRNTIAL